MGIVSRALCALALGAALQSTPAAAATVVLGQANEGFDTFFTVNLPSADLVTVDAITSWSGIGQFLIGSEYLQYTDAGNDVIASCVPVNGNCVGTAPGRNPGDFLQVSISRSSTHLNIYVRHSLTSYDQCDTGLEGLCSVLYRPAWVQFDLHSTIPEGLEITRVTSPIPEPSTWALLIAGFGMLGGALRAGRPRQALR